MIYQLKNFLTYDFKLHNSIRNHKYYKARSCKIVASAIFLKRGAVIKEA
jgi:hypothetical protein